MTDRVKSAPKSDKGIVAERDRVERALNKRIRELRCLYDIASITGSTRLTLRERFMEIVNLLPRAFQYPDITFARITLNTDVFKTENYLDSDQKLSTDIIVNGLKAGMVEVGYTCALPELQENLFSKEEHLLLEALAERLGAIAEHRQTEQKVKDERDRTQRYLDLAGVIFVAIDSAGTVTLINRKGCQVLGYKESEIIGRNWFEHFIPPRIKNMILQVSQKVLAGFSEEAEFFENPILTKSGGERMIAWHNTLLRDEGGNILGSLSSGEDITEQKQYQEMLQTISDNSPLGIYILQDEKLQYTNPQFQKMTGYSGQELINRELLSLVFPADSDTVRSETITTEQERNSHPSEYRLIDRNGQVKWIMQTISPIHYKGKNAVLGNLTDITERINLEKKVVEYEELSKMKSDLLATVSHELRTPLATIKGYSTLILDYYTRLDAEETKDYLRSIDMSTDRLTKLVENLLDTSRMDSGLLKLEKSPVDIMQLIQGVVTEASIRAEQYCIVVKPVKKLPKIDIDARRIRQVLDNLIDNATKYSPPQKEIVISAEKSGADIIISIADQGPGIPPGEITKIFERMYRIEQRMYTGADGIGLGLYICQRLVQDHGGRIWAESAPGRGSTFRFTLPLIMAKKKELLKGQVRIREK
jgi:PAS domain S-box-containing protein